MDTVLHKVKDNKIQKLEDTVRILKSDLQKANLELAEMRREKYEISLRERMQRAYLIDEVVQDDESTVHEQDVESTDSPREEGRWGIMYKLLKDYKNLENHASPTKKEIFGGKRLGWWVKKERRNYKLRQQGSLPKDSKVMTVKRIDLLKDIGFVFRGRP